MHAANDAFFDNTLELDLLPGQSMQIDLNEPASSGFLWRLAEGPSSGIQAQLSRPTAPAPLPDNVVALAVGAPSRASLRLAAPSDATPLEDCLVLVLERPFAPDPPLKRLRVVLRVSPLN